MQSFLSVLAELAQLKAQLNEMTTRVPAIQYAIVTEIDQARRKIRISRESQGGQAQGYWIEAGRRSPFEDEPLPPVGTTVVVGFIQGNPHDAILLRTIPNQTNPPDRTQRSPKDDLTTEIPGDERRNVAGNRYDLTNGDRTDEIEKNFTIQCNGSTVAIDSTRGNIEVTALDPANGVITIKGFNTVRLQDGRGAFIQVSNGVVTIHDKSGSTVTLSSGNCVFDMNGGTFGVENCDSFYINSPGNQVATIGATDDDGDDLITRGW